MHITGKIHNKVDPVYNYIFLHFFILYNSPRERKRERERM